MPLSYVSEETGEAQGSEGEGKGKGKGKRE
jgi:hypothetical protein